MEFPDNLKYTNEHEWIRVEGDNATIGITEYAQDQLGDIVFVELPDENDVISKGDAFGVVESVKSVSDVYSPLSGKVVEVNDPLKETPETINEDPYNEGWLIRIEMSDKSELEDYKDSEAYGEYVKEEKV